MSRYAGVADNVALGINQLGAFKHPSRVNSLLTPHVEVREPERAVHTGVVWGRVSSAHARRAGTSLPNSHKAGQLHRVPQRGALPCIPVSQGTVGSRAGTC